MEKIKNKTIGLKKWIFIFLLFLAISMWLGIAFSKDNKYVDEREHTRQISRVRKGDFKTLPNLTTLPGYHWVVAAVTFPIKHPTTRQLRLISLGLSLLSIGAFYILAKKIKLGDPLIRTLQFTFLPVSFIYFPLVYTDIFSLLLLFLAFFFLLSRRYHWSAVFSLAALLVRQNNIIWIAFFWLYAYFSENGFLLAREHITDFARRTLGHLVVFILFILFVQLNGGIAIGDQEDHQLGFYRGNLYYFLFMAGILFLPLLIAALARLKPEKLKKIIWGIIFAAAAAVSFFIFIPEIHRYNFGLGFLRNIILHHAYDQYAWAYAVLIFIGFMALYLTRFEKKALLVFPFIFLYLVPSLLVEQRYLIVPFALILLLRQESGRKMEWVATAYFILLSAGLLGLLLKARIFF